MSPRGRGWWPRLSLLAVVLIVAGHLVGTGALVLGRDLLLEQVGQPLIQRLADDPNRTFSAERYATTFAAYLTQAQRALDPRQLAVLGPLAGLVAAVWWFWARRVQPTVALAIVIAPLLLFMWSRFPTVPSGAGADELAQVAALPGLREGAARVVSWKLRAAAYELNLATLAAQGNAPAATFALQRAGLTPNWGSGHARATTRWLREPVVGAPSGALRRDTLRARRAGTAPATPVCAGSAATRNAGGGGRPVPGALPRRAEKAAPGHAPLAPVIRWRSASECRLDAGMDQQPRAATGLSRSGRARRRFGGSKPGKPSPGRASTRAGPWCSKG